MRNVLMALLPLAVLMAGQAVAEDEVKPDTTLDRQSLRAQQNTISEQEIGRGEDRLDAVNRKARTDPRAARDMQRIYEADQSLSGSLNRPPPLPGAR